MKPLARLIWQLIHWSGVIVMLVFGGLLIVQSRGSGPSFSDVLVSFACIASLAGGRVLSVAGLRNLDLLPDSHRMLVRALATLTVITSLLLGGFTAWIDMHRLAAAPFTGIALIFVTLSGLSFMFFARAQITPVRWVSILAIASLTALTLIAMSRQTPAVSWIAAGLCAFLWVFALRSRKVPRPLFAHATGAPDPAALFVEWRARALLVRSPAGAVLNGNRVMSARLPVAVAFIIIWALICHVVIGHAIPVDSYAISVSVAACFISGLMLIQSVGIPARARPLWLRMGGSRADIFRIVEKSLLANLAVLGGLSWLVMSCLALARGLGFNGLEALLTLAGLGVGALASIYFGLLLPTLGSAWLRIPATVLAVLTLIFPPLLWIRGVAADVLDGGPFTSWTLATTLVFTCWALRALALNRWKTIDWTRVRPETARELQ